MSKLFISYATEDSDFAEILRLALRDMEIVGSEFSDISQISILKQEIRDNIRTANAVVVLLSPAAAASNWVSFEVGVAKALSKPIIPLLLSGATVEEDSILGIPSGPEILDARNIPVSMVVEQLQKLLASSTLGIAMADPIDLMSYMDTVNVVAQVFRKCFAGVELAGAKTKERDPFAKAAKRYDERLRETCDTMRVLGMRKPVPLTNIYTTVNILERITAYDWKSLKELEKSFDRGKRSFGVIKEEAKPGIQVVNELPKFILLGKPGSGKTTFLKYVALQALDGKLDEELIPVFISLKQFADSGESLIDFITKEFTICAFPLALPYIPQIMKSGLFILLLDGLDEVSKEKNESVVQEINELCDTYRDNHIIISCRIAAYNHWFQDFTDVELADFTDDQIQSVVNNWFGDGSEKTELCWSQLNSNKPIKELASSPLLLTLFCIAFDKNMNLPKNRAELYQGAVDALLKEWDGSRSIKRDEIYHDLSTRRKEIMFSRIAAETFEKEQLFLPHRVLEDHIVRFTENLPEANQETLEPDSKVILRAIEAQHGIFVERAKGIYSFSHLTLQEFFTAKYIVENAPKCTLQTLIEDHLTDDKWKEVFLITTGMLGEADDFLLMIKEAVDKTLEHKKLVEFLKGIQSAVMKKDKLHHPALMAYGIRFVLEGAIALDSTDAFACDSIDAFARVIDRTFTIARSLDPTLALGRTFERDRAYTRALDLGYALDLDRGPLDQFAVYLQMSKLLIDCLNTECYLSKTTRQKIWSELLTVP